MNNFYFGCFAPRTVAQVQGASYLSTLPMSEADENCEKQTLISPSGARYTIKDFGISKEGDSVFFSLSASDRNLRLTGDMVDVSISNMPTISRSGILFPAPTFR